MYEKIKNTKSLIEERRNNIKRFIVKSGKKRIAKSFTDERRNNTK